MLLLQANTAEKSREARAQLEAAKARHHKLVEARRTVKALQSALEAGQAQVHHHCFASRLTLTRSGDIPDNHAVECTYYVNDTLFSGCCTPDVRCGKSFLP